jgi:hypothetical protein
VLGGSDAVAVLHSPGGVGVGAVASIVCVLGALAGGHLLAAFRGSAPRSTFNPGGTGPAVLIGWYLLPGLAVLIVGTVAAVLAHGSSNGLLWGAVLALAVFMWGLSKAERLAEAHRV